MSKVKYLHVGSAAVFIGPLLKVIDAEFDRDEHLFILYDSLAGQSLREEKNVIIYNGRSFKGICCYVLILWYLFAARKVFLHGLFDVKMLLLLFLTPFWGGKVYWIAWGGDLYDRFYESGGIRGGLTKYLRARVIKRVKHIVTYLRGDYRRASEWFGCDAEYHECFVYPSNICEVPDADCNNAFGAGLNVMVGNSANPLNNHEEVFRKLVDVLPLDARVYAPLSYGDEAYRGFVIELGNNLFGDRFSALERLMPLEEYEYFLKSIDVFIFNHPIQQAMGNTIKALGLGKTVFLREGTSQWELFKNIGVEVLSTNRLHELGVCKDMVGGRANAALVGTFFSRKNYIDQLRYVFGE